MTAERLTMKNAEINGIGHGHRLDIHEIIQAPVLLGITEVELNLEAQRVVINDLVSGQVKVGAEQHHMTTFSRFEMGFDDDHDVERIGKRRVEDRQLVGVQLILIIDDGMTQSLNGQMVVVEFLTVTRGWAARRLGTGIGQIRAPHRDAVWR